MSYKFGQSPKLSWIATALLLSACNANAVAPTATPKPAVTFVAPQSTPTTALSNTAPIAARSTTTPDASAKPSASPQFLQLTTGGCCVQPFFAPDGSQVLYLDKPTQEAEVGIYGVPIAQPLAAPTLFSPQLGPFSRDMSLSVDLINKQTTITKRADNSRWVIDNGGRSVSISPDNSKVAWNVSQDSGNFDVRRSEVWIANIDGSDAKRVLTRYGGGMQGWLSDSQHILLGGKANRNDAKSTLSIYDLRDGSSRDLYSTDRMRGQSLSPDDRWMAFFVAQSREPSNNGMFLMQIDSSATVTQPQRLDWFGTYRWRDAHHLVYVPLKLGQPSHELWQLDVDSGQSTQLIAASADSPFKIGNGDWDISDDGAHLLFVSAKDRNIWLFNLPSD